MPSMSEGLAEASPSVEAEPKPNLERGLGTLDATMIGIGSMIGSGIFIVSADVSKTLGAPGWLLLAWGLAGLLTILGSPCAGEVAAMYPRAGGQYVFLREAYGRSIGFVFGWSTLLVIQTGTIAAVAVAFAKFLGVFLPQVAATEYLIRPIHLGDHYAISLTTQQGVAILIILGLTWMNTRGLRTGKIVMNLFTFTKTAALIALIVLGIGYGMLHAGDRAAAAWSSSWWDSSANGWNLDAATKASGVPVVGMLGFLMLFGKAMVGPLFSQTGWNGVTFTGGEVRDPGKTLPRALLISCGTVVLLYLLANAAYVMTLSLGEIQNAPNERVGTATMQKIFPGFGAQIMAVAIMVSTFGCINGLILSGARVYYAMARDGLFFRRAGMTNSRHVPAFALIAQGIWAAILVLPLTIKGLKPGTNMHDYGNLYGQLLDYIVPVDLLFYSLMVGSVIVFRLKRPDAERPYRAIGYPVTPLIYIGLAFLMVANFIYLSPKVSGIGFLIALTGLPVYFVWSRFGRKTSDDTALV
jgi:basic amino acid/polyamine antiporter, APA family